MKQGSLATPSAARKRGADTPDEKPAGLTGAVKQLHLSSGPGTPQKAAHTSGIRGRVGGIEIRGQRRVVEFDVVREMDSFW
jgi:hypothetical protein